MNEQPEQMDDQQMDKIQRIVYLISAYIRGSISPLEHDELDDWVAESDANMKLFEELTDEKKIKKGIDWMESIDSLRALKRVKSQVQFTRNNGARPMFSRNWHYAVAASLLLVLGAGAFLLYNKKNTVQPALLSTNTAKPHDVAPGSIQKATLMLDDGRTLVLDQTNDGTLATQGNSEIVKQNGQILYNSKASPAALDAVMFNTVTTPRGGSYPLILSDGTKVWLNAASSIRFPAVFKGTERRVSITGEAYFEVAKNKAMPFKVEVKDRDMVVEVLGTHFNINSYSDEPVIKTTLLEGSVKVLAKDKVSFLKPGQQAQVKEGDIKTAVVNTDQEIAWQTGYFWFRNTDLRSIMKQVSRWYDVDIEFATNANPSYNSKLKRDIPASNLFEVLQENGGVHFRIDGKKITVLP